MQFRTRVKDGTTYSEVVDPSDNTVVRSEVVGEGQQFVVTATSADSPADLEFGEVEAIPEPEAEGTEGGATEGEGTGEAGTGSEPPAGDGSGTEDEGGTTDPTTSAACEKPLYRVFGEDVPEGFTAAGLETPDGFTLYTFEGDTEGQPHTFDVGDASEVGLYAEADDGEQPVVSVPVGGE